MRSLRLVAVLLCLALAGTVLSALPAQAATNQKGTYTPLTASRLLDTRKAIGVPEAGKLGPGQSLDLQVSGRGGVPTAGVSAVVINLTVTEATANSYLAAYPTGGARPRASAINFVKNIPLANIATVPLGTGGKVTIFNLTGSVSVLADVMGFYAATDVPSQTAGPGNEFDVVDPQRLVDTRQDRAGPVAANQILTTLIDFYGGNAPVRALALNITATGAQGSGYLTMWNGVGNPPTTSTLNYRVGTTIANMAVVQTTRCTDCSTPGSVQFGIFNGSSRPVHVLVDLVGVYYNDGSVGLRFDPVPPVRISDSRTGQNGVPLTTGQTQLVTAPSDVADSASLGLVANVAVIAPTNSTYLTLWKAGLARPGVSNLNAGAGVTAANGAIIGLSGAKQFNVFNLSGSGNFIIDVTGRFKQGAAAKGQQQEQRWDTVPR